MSARSHVFTDEQLQNLSAISWLYRAQNEKFNALLAHYQQQAAQQLALWPQATSRPLSDTRRSTKPATR